MNLQSTCSFAMLIVCSIVTDGVKGQAIDSGLVREFSAASWRGGSHRIDRYSFSGCRIDEGYVKRWHKGEKVMSFNGVSHKLPNGVDVKPGFSFRVLDAGESYAFNPFEPFFGKNQNVVFAKGKIRRYNRNRHFVEYTYKVKTTSGTQKFRCRQPTDPRIDYEHLKRKRYTVFCRYEEVDVSIIDINHPLTNEQQ